MMNTVAYGALGGPRAAGLPRRRVHRNCEQPGQTPDPSQMDKMNQQMQQQVAQMQEMMQQNPEMQKQVMQMQEMLQKSPEMQKQVAERMQAMQQFAGKKELYEELEQDPEMADFFKAIKTEGPAALFRYMNDPVMLKKFADKMGEKGMMPPSGGGADPASAAAAAPPPQTEQQVENLLDAAKYGDVEAVEDFLAVGKDVNMTDPQGRTPLHYAIAHRQAGIVEMLLKEGANLAAQDEQGNTVVHYAAGYGCVPEMRLLISAGADPATANAQSKTPLDVAKMDAQNPVSKHKDIMDWLKQA